MIHLRPSSNPNGIQIHQPRVARNELPWVTFPKMFSTLKALHHLRPKRQRAGALQDASRDPVVPGNAPASCLGLRWPSTAFPRSAAVAKPSRSTFANPRRKIFSTASAPPHAATDPSAFAFAPAQRDGHNRAPSESSVRSEIFVATHATRFPSPVGAAYSAPDGA